jgi:Activator of Hsp90 ATPase homolog 1-like protein
MSIGHEHNLEIKKTIIIDASSEVVFKAITEPEELTQWIPDQAILVPKIGGKVRFVTLKKFILSGNLIETTLAKGLSRNLFRIRNYPIPG